MKLPNKRPSGRYLPLIAAAVFAGCGATLAARQSAPPAPVNGPAADYPVVVGDPYTAGGVSFTPEDKLNYDEVGYVAIDSRGGTAISGEHHTLPLPSYVEVTSLETGKTILVRLERRGPMDGSQSIGRSPGAAQLLGVSAGSPVRVRRVNPPEEERAALRAGQRAPERIDTPMGLVNVLRRKLPGGEGALASSTDLTAKPAPSTVALPPSTANAAPASPLAPVAARSEKPSPAPVAASSPPALAPLEPVDPPSAKHAAVATIGTPGQQNFPWVTSGRQAPAKPAAKAAQPKQQTVAVAVAKPAAQKPAAAPKPAPAATAVHDGFVVQAGAFSTRARAEGVAKAIGGSVGNAGKLFRVRTGPFGSRKEAEASLAKVKAAGYSDARIYSTG